MFETMLKEKVRFNTTRGIISAESVYDMPLSGDFSLDSLAKSINGMIIDTNEESFVVSNKTKGDKLLELQLEFVKHVIKVKLEASDAAQAAAIAATRRTQLLRLRDKKLDESLENLTLAEVEALLGE